MANPDPGRATDIISRILGFVDKPWKAFALAGLLIVGGAGWIIWVERDKLLDAFLADNGPPVFRTSALGDLMTSLLEETNADIVSVWTVDLGENAVHHIAGRQRDAGPWKVIPSRLPAIRGDSDLEILSEVLSGNPGCIGFEGRMGVLAKRLVADGMKELCWVPVDHFGAVSLAWKDPPDEAERDAALGVARELGSKTVIR